MDNIQKFTELLYHRHKFYEVNYILTVLYNLMLIINGIRCFPVSPNRPSGLISGTRPTSS
jgi:hypothetical protein